MSVGVFHSPASVQSLIHTSSTHPQETQSDLGHYWESPDRGDIWSQMEVELRSKR